MNKTKISPNLIKEAIISEGLRIKRKKELYEEIKKIENELKKINEASLGMAGSFGFVGDKSNVSKTGFVDDNFQNISNIARLEKEFAEQDAINEEVLDENQKLRNEVDNLKSQLEEIKNKINNK